MRRPSFMVFVGVTATFLFTPLAWAAVVTGAALQVQGKVVELSFPYRGRDPYWHLSIHGEELWIDLEQTALRIPSRPRLHESPPVRTLRATDPGGGHCRIVIQVSGKIDYVVATVHHTLIVRLAPAGTVADLATPLLAQIQSRRVTPDGRSTRAANEANPANLSPGRYSHGAATRRQPYVQPRKAATTLAAQPATPREVRDEPTARLDGGASQVRRTAYTVGQRRAQPLVVIDAGHGGRDPGTGAGGYAEKTLALQIAIRLRKALTVRGIRTIMTRDSDTFVSLADRTDIANRADADLFVSIHLNSNPNSATAGITTYYLNNTT
ncbi:MAG: N-acetylmuramoyl-L-alanine amidase family protein, partial [Candidatus Binataceae bacterium]